MSNKSPFPFNIGCGSSTVSEVVCDWCHTTYNKGLLNDDDPEGDSIRTVNFGELQIAQCCFDKLERAVFRSMEKIIPWVETLASQRKIEAENLQDLAIRGKEALSRFE